MSEDQHSPRDQWIRTWNEFNSSIRDISSEFDQFYWIRRLFRDGSMYMLQLLYLKRLSELMASCTSRLIPSFAIFLVLSVIYIYRRVLHETVIVERWCPQNDEDCTWSQMHWFFAHYLVVMILSNFIRTALASPGFVIPPKSLSTSTHHLHKEGTGIQTNSFRKRCSVLLGRQLDIDAEHHRMSLYTPYQHDLKWHPPEGHVFVPSPNPSFCKKCNMYRPPRSHHCSKSNLCVLQMDHYCLWLNNCVGYYNYRTFLLTLAYLVLGCGYGVAILFPPFYGLLQKQVQTHGWKIWYENKTGFLDLPTPKVLWHQVVYEGSISYEVGLKVTVPLLCTAGLILAVFFITHIQYVFMGVTTLERMAWLHLEKDRSMAAIRNRNRNQNSEDQSNAFHHLNLTIVNPFDQGFIGNMRQMMGVSVLSWIIPFFHLEILPPFIPDEKEKET